MPFFCSLFSYSLNVLFEFYRVVVERLAFLLMGEFSELMGLGGYLLDTHAAAHLPLIGLENVCRMYFLAWERVQSW